MDFLLFYFVGISRLDIWIRSIYQGFHKCSKVKFPDCSLTTQQFSPTFGVIRPFCENKKHWPWKKSLTVGTLYNIAIGSWHIRLNNKWHDLIILCSLICQNVANNQRKQTYPKIRDYPKLRHSQYYWLEKFDNFSLLMRLNRYRFVKCPWNVLKVRRIQALSSAELFTFSTRHICRTVQHARHVTCMSAYFHKFSQD